MTDTARKKGGVFVRNYAAGGKKMEMVAYYKVGKTIRGIYADAMDVFVDVLAERIRNDQQNVVVVTGDTGSGKSTFAIQLCYALSKRLAASFDLADDYIYSLDDLWDKLERVDACPISLFDEGAVTLSSSNAMRRDDRDMVTLFNTMRSRGWTTVIAIPSIYHLNKSVRAAHVDFMCRCNSPDRSLIRGYGRGFVEIYKAKRGTFSKGGDPYWTLMYTGIFGDLSPRIKQKYLPIKEQKQDDLINGIIRRSREEKDKPKRGRGRPKNEEINEESECKS